MRSVNGNHRGAGVLPDNAESTLRFAIESHHPRLVMACSFQKEESVLIDMLMAIEPSARVFTIDTGVLFPETYETWRRIEDRYGLKIEVVDALPPNGTPWSAASCCGARKVEALDRALEDTAAWITGIRREQSPTRADAETRRMGRRAGGLEVQSSGRLERRGSLDLRARSRSSLPSPPRQGLRFHRLRPLHDAGKRPGRTLGRPGENGVRAARVSVLAAGPHKLRAHRMSYEIAHLRALESEAIHVIREVAAELERGVLLFSGGKDSAVLLHLARKAFHPAGLPFPVMHVDTGHNFPEVLEYRDRMVEELEARLIVASVQDSIDSGRVIEERGPRASRNRLQSVTLLDAIEEHGFKAAFGGARRDEERARAKERILSFRDDFGQWDPKAQRPELWNVYNGFVKPGEHVRVFPLSNWTELDVWQYIKEERIDLPPIYFAHKRSVFRRDGMLYAVSEFVELLPGEEPFEESVRFRTVGDMSCTGAIASTATTLESVVAEIAATRITERGETRADDRISEAAMEDRKKEGYF